MISEYDISSKIETDVSLNSKIETEVSLKSEIVIYTTDAGVLYDQVTFDQEVFG